MTSYMERIISSATAILHGETSETCHKKSYTGYGTRRRQNIQHSYSIRLRDDALFDVLFNEQKDKPEIKHEQTVCIVSIFKNLQYDK